MFCIWTGEKFSAIDLQEKFSHLLYKKINAKYEKITTHTWIINFFIVNWISYTIACLIWLSESFYNYFIFGGGGLGEGLLSLVNTFLCSYLTIHVSGSKWLPQELSHWGSSVEGTGDLVLRAFLVKSKYHWKRFNLFFSR